MSRCLLRKNGHLFDTAAGNDTRSDYILVRVNAPDEKGVGHELDVTL